MVNNLKTEYRMEEKNFFLPDHENEKIVIFARRHFASMLGAIVIVLVMFLTPIILWLAVKMSNFTIFPEGSLPFLIIGVSIYYLIVVTYAFTEWVSYYYSYLAVTENDIIDINQRGIFNRHITEVSLLRVQDVSAQIKGFIPTFFSYGDVIAESAGENTRTYVIDNIPKPMEVANKILDMHNEHIAREERAAEIITAEGDLRKQVIGAPANIVQPLSSSTPPCPPFSPITTAPPPHTEGDINQNDLNQGGEIKF